MMNDEHCKLTKFESIKARMRHLHIRSLFFNFKNYISGVKLLIFQNNRYELPLNLKIEV